MNRVTILRAFFITAAFLARPAAATPPTELPWQREMPLREAAQSVELRSTLNATNPLPDFGGGPFNGPSMVISNLKMRSTIWGPPDRITISVTKNDVWDRRLHEFQAPTLQEITDGADAPINKDYVGVRGNSLRPIDLGWLRKEAGSYDPYRKPMRYAFPSLKPVGQIIVGIDDLNGADPPTVTQNFGSALTKVQAARGDAKATLEYVLGMTSNTYAIRGTFSGLSKSVSLRLYRHRDTTHLMYMSEDGKHYTNPAAEADKAFNGPIDPPSSGIDGRYFWIRQKMPPEKTFPQGFEYVMMGIVTSSAEVKLETAENKTRLGTPPQNQRLNGEWGNVMRPVIADAPGAAATATLDSSDGKLEAFVTVVTTNDGPDIMALAKQRLAKMAPGGFDGVLQENVRWTIAPSAEVAFHHFQARGGFLVSAARNADGVYYLEIQPRRDNQCKLMNPWPGKSVVVRQDGQKSVPIELDNSIGQCIMFPTAAGHTYRIEAQ